MSQILTPFVYQMGAGVGSGFLVGYAIKKVLKILMIILGFAFVALSCLGFSEIVTVNYEKLGSAALGLVTQASGFLSTTSGGLPFASTFLAGFGVGIMKG